MQRLLSSSGWGSSELTQVHDSSSTIWLAYRQKPSLCFLMSASAA